MTRPSADWNGTLLLSLWLCSRIAAILLPLDLPCTSVSGQISPDLATFGQPFPYLDGVPSEPGLGI